MNAEQIEAKADNWAENAWLRLIGRASMVVLGTIGPLVAIWMGNTLWEMKSDQAKLSGQIEVLTLQIQQGISDRYRGKDADRDFAKRDQKDSEHDRRLDRIELRVDRVEGYIRQSPGGPR